MLAPRVLQRGGGLALPVRRGLHRGGLAKSGSFYLSFRDELSSEIQHDASAADVKAAIEASIAVGRVSVTFSGSAACNLANLMSVEFLTEFGDVPMLCVCQRLFLSRPRAPRHAPQPLVRPTPPLRARRVPIKQSRAGPLSNLTITETRKGTKEDLECSQSGKCNRDIGQCTCKSGHVSSSGEVATRADGTVGERGQPGERADCGFRHTGTQEYDIGVYAFALSGGAA